MVKAAEQSQLDATTRGPGKTQIQLRVNGAEYELLVEPRRTLLDALRNDLALTGTKKVCDLGQCGACTLLVDGKAVYSCLLLAVECIGHEIQTIEGLADGVALDPVQQAFVECDAYQCGYCTPGQIMSLRALLRASSQPTEDDVRRAVSGNLCRCGAYQHIVQAGMRAAAIARGEGAAPPLERPELPPTEGEAPEVRHG